MSFFAAGAGATLGVGAGGGGAVSPHPRPAVAIMVVKVSSFGARIMARVVPDVFQEEAPGTASPEVVGIRVGRR